MDRSLYKGLAISKCIGSDPFPWQRTMGGHLLSQGWAFVPCYLGLFWAILWLGLHLRQMLGSTTVSWIWVPLAGLTFFFLASFLCNISISLCPAYRPNWTLNVSLKYFGGWLIQLTAFFQNSSSADQTCTVLSAHTDNGKILK